MLAFITWHYFSSNPFVLGFLLSATICLVLALIAGIVIWAVFFETSRRYEDTIVALEKSLGTLQSSSEHSFGAHPYQES